MTPLIQLTVHPDTIPAEKYEGTGFVWVNPSYIISVSRNTKTDWTSVAMTDGNKTSLCYVEETPEQINALIRGGTSYRVTKQEVPPPPKETTNEI